MDGSQGQNCLLGPFLCVPSPFHKGLSLHMQMPSSGLIPAAASTVREGNCFFEIIALSMSPKVIETNDANREGFGLLEANWPLLNYSGKSVHFTKSRY